MQVLIGTNLAGLSGFIAESLERRIAEITLVHQDEEGLAPEERLALVEERVERALLGVRIGAVGAARLAREASAIAAGLGVDGAPRPELFEGPIAAGTVTLAASRDAVRPLLEPALAPWAARLGSEGPDAVRHLVELTSRHAAVLAWRAGLAAALASGAQAARRQEEAFRALLRELFLATIVPLHDPGLTGDQVIDAVARACPPGFRAHVMGLQNIKGTGLDFAYRWVDLDATSRALDDLRTLGGADAVSAATRIVEAKDHGVLALSLIEETLRAAAADAAVPHHHELDALADRARERLKEKEATLGGRKAPARAGWVHTLEKVLDVWDGIARRRRAGTVLDELCAGRVSSGDAAAALRALMSRQKGGWLLEKRGS